MFDRIVSQVGAGRLYFIMNVEDVVVLLENPAACRYLQLLCEAIVMLFAVLRIYLIFK